MYLTFLINSAKRQLTWEDILKNPFLTAETAAVTRKKITKEIPLDYANKLAAQRISRITIPWATVKLPDDFDTSEHYRHFQIPKKSNPHKMRQIDAPDELLSITQTTYKTIIEDMLQVLPHKAAHAYVKNRSTITAMETHQKNQSNWYLQIDLKDFFNSITGTWLKYMLLRVFPFPYIGDENLDDLIRAALLNGTLPQGSHLSPLLTNLAMVPIDHELTEKLNNYKGHHYVYTRYADDITISCKEKFDPEEIMQIIRGIFRKWNVPFRVNNEKTRFGSKAGRNYHLGIIVNKDNQLSVGHEKNQKFRAMIFNFCTIGDEWEKHDVQKMLGLISYYKAIEPDFVNKVIRKYNEKFNIDIMSKAKAML